MEEYRLSDEERSSEERREKVRKAVEDYRPLLNYAAAMRVAQNMEGPRQEPVNRPRIFRVNLDGKVLYL